MGLLSRRKNKKFSYQSRYYKNESGESPYTIKHKFDDQRRTVQKHNLIDKFTNVRDDMTEGMDQGVKYRLLIIIAILLLVFLWIIDFDLSIFTQ